MLTLTSCTRVSEPGFSPSECLELARMVELDGLPRPFDDIDCDYKCCGGTIVSAPRISPEQTALIVAALRAYAHA